MSGIRYQGVDVDNPRIIAGIRNLLTHKEKKYTTAEISRIIGMPVEVIRRYEKEYEQEKKMK